MEDMGKVIIEAQQNSDKLNKLIEQYIPFIKSCVARSRPDKQSRDDALTLAMLAFVDCVMAYELKKGSFFTFAQTGIRNRLIDDYRTNQKHNAVPLLEEEGEGWETKLSVMEHTRHLEQIALQSEIEEVSGVLSGWNTSFSELVKICPKQKRTRAKCQYIAMLILKNEVWRKTLIEKRRLPSKDICEMYGVSVKIMEKYRKYIAVICMIQSGDYPRLRAFLPINLQGSEEDE